MRFPSVGQWLLALILCAAVESARAADWPQFRGPGGLGVSAESGLPTQWDNSHGLVWKIDLDGAGSSSPIVVGDKVLLTYFTAPGEADMARHLICVDRATGNKLWDKAVPCAEREDSWRGMLREHGYTSSTPASDGTNVYVFYGKVGALAYDLNGNELWRRNLGTGSDNRGWGSASSPVLYKDTVIINAGTEGGVIVALNKKDGKDVWRAEAESARGTWGTPTLVDLPGGKQELVLGVPFEVWGLNPENGKLRWYAEAISAEAMCTSVVAHEGVVYVTGGRQGGSAAIKAGGSGDVTKTHVVWKSSKSSYVTSPVYKDGYLYWVSDRGTAVCLNAKTGETVYEKRLDGASKLYASLTAADGKLYAVSRFNGTFVIDGKPEFSVISHNELTDETDFNASPAVSNGRLFLRSNKALYCLGAK